MKQQVYFKKILLAFVSIILVLGFGFLMFMLIDRNQTKLILKNDYVMTGMGISVYLIILLIVIVGNLLVYLFSKLLKTKITDGNEEFARFTLKRWYIILPLFVFITAFATFTFTAVKGNEIVKYNIFHLGGKSYDFSLTDKIETGFDKHGEFYYNVEIDEKKFKLMFNSGSIAEDFEDESYSEYRFIDKRIFEMSPDVEKKTSLKYINKYGYNDETIEILTEIINYKGE